MLELYQDDLADLLLPASQKQLGPQKVPRHSCSLLILVLYAAFLADLQYMDASRALCNEP